MSIPLPFFGYDGLDLAIMGWVMGVVIYICFCGFMGDLIKDEGVTKVKARVFIIGIFLIPVLVFFTSMYFVTVLVAIFLFCLIWIGIESLLSAKPVKAFVSLVKAAQFIGPRVIKLVCPECGSSVMYNQWNNSSMAKCEKCHHPFPPYGG